MTVNDYARQRRLETKRRYKLRQAGQLPPLPACESCGKKVITDNLYCWICSRKHGRVRRQEVA